MCMQKPKPSKVPLWVRIMNIPLDAWNSKGISRIASNIDNHVIEVEVELGIVDEIEVHGYDKCNSRPVSDAEKSHGTELRGQRREADMGNDNGMNDCRGGFSGRGRGGFGGKGFGDHRFNRVEGSKYVPVKKNGNEAVKDGMVIDHSNKGKNKQDVDMNTNEVNNRNGVNKGSMDSGKKDSRKKNMKKHNTTDNRFAELIDESEIEKNLEWESMRQRIDLACEKVVHISIEEKNSWDEELINYFMINMQEVIKRVNVSDLKVKISNLKKQIGHSNKMIAIETRDRANKMVKSVMVERGLTENQAYQKIFDEVYRDELDRIKVLDMRKQCAKPELFFKTGQVFTIYELETWTDEMLEFYKASIGEEAYMKIFKQIRSDSNESIDDEIDEDLSEIAQFMAKNVVTNGIDTDLN
ncbi:hypothetical protein Tco_0505368 [Tanacetum coccineum]